MALTTRSERYESHNIHTGTTGEAIASKRFCLKWSSGTLVKTTANTDSAVGLAKEDYASGDQAEFISRGTLMYIAGGTIAEGDQLTPDDGTAGRIKKAASGDKVVGNALHAASAGEWALGYFDFIGATLV